jgi:nucleotidyltransferase substrate binding protein (TIGR01987 family)
MEFFLKFLKKILEFHGLEVFFPKDILQEAYAGHLIDDDTLWLQMLNDRNLTSHTYDQKLADQIYANIKTYFPVLKKAYLELREQYVVEGRE